MAFGFKGATRIAMYGRMARALEQQYHVTEVLELLHQHASDDGKRRGAPAAKALRAWRSSLDAGTTFSDALEGWCPPAHVMLVQAGEQSDTLPHALKMCAHVETVSGQMRSAIAGMFVYPVVLFALMMTLFFFFAVQVMPQFEVLAPASTWTGISATMPGVFSFVTDGGLLISVALFILWLISLKWVMPGWTGPVRKMFDGVPPFSLYKVWQAVMFLFSLASLLGSGLSVGDSLLMIRTRAKPWLRQRIDGLYQEVSSGLALGQAFWKADPDFPDRDLNRELRLVAELQDFDRQVEQMAEHLLSETLARLQKLTGTVKMLGVALNTGMLAWLMLGTMGIVENQLG